MKQKRTNVSRYGIFKGKKYLGTNAQKCKTCVTFAKIGVRKTREGIQVVFQRLVESKIKQKKNHEHKT